MFICTTPALRLIFFITISHPHLYNIVQYVIAPLDVGILSIQILDSNIAFHLLRQPHEKSKHINIYFPLCQLLMIWFHLRSCVGGGGGGMGMGFRYVFFSCLLLFFFFFLLSLGGLALCKLWFFPTVSPAYVFVTALSLVLCRPISVNILLCTYFV